MAIVTSSLQLYLVASDTGSYPGSGSIWRDLSPNGYVTEWVGDPIFNTYYFDFDGTTKYVNTQQSLASDNFSVGAWFKTSTGGIKMILSKETPNGLPWNYRIWLYGGQIVADIAVSEENSQTITSVRTDYYDGIWHHVMFTRDGSNLNLYVDGVQVNTAANTIIGSIVNPHELWIGQSAFTAGGSNPNGSYQFDGDIGEVFVYNAVLNPSEVFQNFYSTSPTYYNPPPTSTPTPTPTSTPTSTPTATPSPTPTSTPTVTPTPTPTRCPQNKSGSMYFDGSSYVEIQSSSYWAFQNLDFLIEFYMKQETVGIPDQTIFKLADGINWLELKIETGFFKFTMANQQIIGNAEPVNPLNEWTHIAVSHYNDNLYIFQDGILLDYFNHPEVYITDTANPLYIGGGPNVNPNNYFNGHITNFHIMKGASLYDGGMFERGRKVFNRPATPLPSNKYTRLMLHATNPCDVLYDPTHNKDLEMISHGVVYNIDSPYFRKIRIPVGEYFLEGVPYMNDQNHYLFGLGKETVSPLDGAFTYGDKVVLLASQKKYSFDYYEIHSPVTVVNSSNYYVTLYGFTASFDPRTEVCLTVDADLSGSNSPIIARYR